MFISNLLRRLAVLGATAFFGLLIVLLIGHLSQNPQVIQTALNGIGDMLSDIFSLAGSR